MVEQNPLSSRCSCVHFGQVDFLLISCTRSAVLQSKITMEKFKLPKSSVPTQQLIFLIAEQEDKMLDQHLLLMYSCPTTQLDMVGFEYIYCTLRAFLVQYHNYVIPVFKMSPPKKNLVGFLCVTCAISIAQDSGRSKLYLVFYQRNYCLCTNKITHKNETLIYQQYVSVYQCKKMER